MAGAARGLTPRQAALLLRCQRAREKRARELLLRAEGEHARAAAGRAACAEAVTTGRATDAAERDAAYRGIQGRLVRPGDVAEMPAFEAAIRGGAALRQARLTAADGDERRCREAAEAARTAWRVAERDVAKRDALASRALALWRRERDAAEEAERDEAVADAWRPR